MSTHVVEPIAGIRADILPKLKDFGDLPFEARQRAIQSELVRRELFGKLPPEIAEIFVDCFLYPTDEKAAALKEFFARPDTSVITSNIIGHKPSSHKALEPLYRKFPTMTVDQYFYDCPAGDAIPDRLDAVVANVPDWIRFAGRGKDVVKVIVPGSGPAQDIIRILTENPDLRERVQAYCVDNEPSAIQLGEQLAKKAGVADNIHYIEGDLMKLDYSDMDLALLVGIICPLPRRVCIKIIKQVASYCHKGGLVVVSAALQKMLIEDPVTCFVMDFIGWQLFYKTEEEMRAIIADSGLTWRGSFQEPKSKFHLITIAQKM